MAGSEKEARMWLISGANFGSDSQCNAHFSADSDIGGIGVLTSYLVIAMATTIVTGLNIYTPPIAFYYSLVSWIAAEKRVKYSHEFVMTSMTERSFWFRQFSGDLVNRLCEIQLLTSIGIMLAGLIQIHNLSLYHLDLIWDYWWLTFTAFWAESAQDQTVRKPRSGLLRRIFNRQRIGTILMITSLSLATGYKIFVSDTVRGDWDSGNPGRCYRYIYWFNLKDQLLVVSVVCIFLRQLMLSLHTVSVKWVVELDSSLGDMERRLISTHWTLIECLTGLQRLHSLLGASYPLRLCSHFGEALFLTIVNFTFLLVLWSLRQLLGILGLTHGTRGVGFPFRCCFYSVTVADLISVKILNKPLISNESGWGFGQILPMVLILALGYQVLDAVASADEKVLERRAFLEKIIAGAEGDRSFNRARMMVAETMLPPIQFARPLIGSLYAKAQAIEDRSGHQV